MSNSNNVCKCGWHKPVGTRVGIQFELPVPPVIRDLVIFYSCPSCGQSLQASSTFTESEMQDEISRVSKEYAGSAN